MKPLNIPPDIAIVSHETLEKLHLYHGLLLKWQQKMNLISPNTVPEAWHRHFIDSAQLAPLIPKGKHSLYDIGSGAGFAGLVIAILRPDLEVTLIESDAKKCAFLATVSRETDTSVSIVNKRIEDAHEQLPPPDVVSARALASLSDLFSYVYPWAVSQPSLQLIFPKGSQAAQEISAAEAANWRFHVEQFPSKTEQAAQILRIGGLQRG